MTDILDPSALLSTLSTLLPEVGGQKTLSSPQDGIAALIHSIMTTLAFRLVAVDDSSSPKHAETNTLPEEWNRTGPGLYTLRYKHDQSSLEFILSVSKLGSRTLVNAIAAETDKASNFDISTNDFTSSSFFPHNLSSPTVTPLIHGFISSNRVIDFVSQYKLKILQKVIPGLRKDGYLDSGEEVSATSRQSTSSNTTVLPFATEPSRPRPSTSPVHQGEPFALPSHIPPRNPLEIGRRDLDPFAGRSPFAPPPLFPGNSGDGMFVGPGHPLFGDRVGGPSRANQPGGYGLWGGDGYLPPLGAPPGARFDPVGPGFGRPPRRGGFGTDPRNLGEPDNDEFMPPGAGDMFM